MTPEERKAMEDFIVEAFARDPKWIDRLTGIDTHPTALGELSRRYLQAIVRAAQVAYDQSLLPAPVALPAPSSLPHVSPSGIIKPRK